MKKKIIYFAGIVLAAVLAFGMVGCTEPELHVHTFATEWKSNAVEHWHEATCGDTDEVSGKAAHTWNHEDYQYDSTAGKNIRKCTVCGYIDGKEHIHTWNHEDYQYDSEYNEDIRKCTVCGYVDGKNHVHTFDETKWSTNATHHWHAATCSHTDEVSGKAAHTWNHEDYQYDSEYNEDIRKCTVCGYVDEKNHVHTFSKEWTSNATSHWHAATCGHTTEVSGKAAHTWNHEDYQYDSIAGKNIRKCTVCGYVAEQAHVHTWNHEDYQYDSNLNKDIRKCTVCGYVDEKGHVHTYATEWSTNAIHHWHAATCGHTTEVSGKAAHTWNHEDYQYDSKFDKDIRTCTVCEYVDQKEHVHAEDAGTLTKPVTLAADGEMTYKCSACQKVIRTETIAKPDFNESPVDAETGNAATSSSTYIYFGVFPKTVLPLDSGVTIDERIAVEMGSNTYYKGSDSEWYAKTLENAYVNSPDKATYDSTYTDGTNAKASKEGSYRYFKVVPVKWKVITADYNNTGKALLLAEDILTANVPYYNYDSMTNKRSIGTDTEIFPNNYKYSQIRAYLNGLNYFNDSNAELSTYTNKGFLQTAFTSAAQDKIEVTTVKNGVETIKTAEDADGTKVICADTEDKIFLLSYSEVVNKYGFAEDTNKDKARIRMATDYAKANKAYQYSEAGYGGCWWLRSPCYSNANTALTVYPASYVETPDETASTSRGIVPALTISLP